MVKTAGSSTLPPCNMLTRRQCLAPGFSLRKQFPLVADAMASTATGSDVPIEAIEARNVLDGKKLVDQITKSNTTTYPWGLTGLPPASPAEQNALNAEADALRNAYDAIAD